MKKIAWTFLFLLTFVITYPAFPEGKISITQIDSLRKELNNQKGADKISTQLELAIQIMKSDKHEATDPGKFCTKCCQNCETTKTWKCVLILFLAE